MPFDPEGLVVSQISESDILEYVVGDLSPRQDSMSRKTSDLTLTFIIPGTKLIPFLQYTLGLAYVEKQAGSPATYKLKRSLPMFHPVYTWSWAATVQINGMAFRGDDEEIVVYSDQLTPAKWEKYQAVVSFELPPYKVLPDSGVTSEYQRFLSKTFVPNVELVNLDGGQVVYDSPGTNWGEKPSLQLVSRRETTGVELKWHAVPLEWVQESEDTLPPKLMQMQGRVNSSTFLGQPAETLLCKNIVLEKYVQPLETNAAGDMSFAYDITFQLIQYDPTPKGKASETRKGWNFMLAPDLQYYYATNKTSGIPAFQTYDFAKAFTHWSDV